MDLCVGPMLVKEVASIRLKLEDEMKSNSSYLEECCHHHADDSQETCKQCALAVASYLPQWIEITWRYEANPLDFTHCRYESTWRYASTWRYFTYCLGHNDFALFVFKNSNLWVIVFELFRGELDHLFRWNTVGLRRDSAKTIFQQQKPFAPKGNHLKGNMGFLIIQFAFLWNRKHWNYIYRHIFFPLLSWCFSDFFVLVVLCLYEIPRKVLNGKPTVLREQYAKDLDQWIRRLRPIKMQSTIKVHTMYVTLFHGLNDPMYVCECYEILKPWMKRVRVLRWNRMECQRATCTVSRETQCEQKLYKCKSCKVARYCSRKCQKLDWKTHKPLCQRLTAATINQQKCKLCNAPSYLII